MRKISTEMETGTQMTSETFTDAERDRARRDFADAHRGQERDGWGKFSFDGQGAQEQSRLMQAAREKGAGMATCKSCGAAVIWAKTEKGANGIYDAAETTPPDPEGRYWVIGDDGVARQGDKGSPGHVSHWATCPNAAQHRKKPPVQKEFGA